MSQTENIRNHLTKGKTITPIEALNKFNCFRLSARILDLRKEGMDIKMKLITKNGKTFSMYKL